MTDRKISQYDFEYHSNIKDLTIYVNVMDGEDWELHSVISHGLNLISVMVKYE